MADLKAFAEQLVNLTVKEVNELAQILKDEYGIEPAAAAVAVAAGPAAAAEVVERKIDKSNSCIEVTLRYESYDFDSRIKVEPDGNGITIRVYLDKPLPDELKGKAGFNLEFFLLRISKKRISPTANRVYSHYIRRAILF